MVLWVLYHKNLKMKGLLGLLGRCTRGSGGSGFRSLEAGFRSIWAFGLGALWCWVLTQRARVGAPLGQAGFPCPYFGDSVYVLSRLDSSWTLKIVPLPSHPFNYRFNW